MITRTALVLMYAFAPRFASIQAILDRGDILKNYEVIFAKSSRSD